MKYVKPNYRGKKAESVVIDAMATGKITAYVKHPPTGAMIPIDTVYANKIKNGETFDIGEAERKYNRRYFKVEKLKIRWEKEPDDIVGILQSYSVPCFFIPNEVDTGIDSLGQYAEVGCDDICVFEEYVLAIEKKDKLKKHEVKSRYRGFDRH